MTGIIINHEKRTITLTRAFAKLTSDPTSKEAKILSRVVKDFPDYELIVRTIKKNPNKDTFKGLTYDYMRDYIIKFSDNKVADLKELEDKIFISKCHSEGKRYPVIKKWFLDKYPAVRDFLKFEQESSVEGTNFDMPTAKVA